MIERKPAVSGVFYPDSPDELRETLSELIGRPQKTTKAVGAILPHAGYIYSGKVAGKTVSSIEVPERVVIICPNHTGYGKELSLFPPGIWTFPGFKVKVDDEVTEMLASTGAVQLDTGAHATEHSAEVIIPFLHFVNPDIKISVICVRTMRKDTLMRVASALAEVHRKFGNALFVASSDMNHYETDDISRKKDAIAMERITSLDPEGFVEVCYNMNISVCGIGPVYILLSFLKDIGIRNAKVVAYGNSADTSGDTTAVVGYAGIIFF